MTTLWWRFEHTFIDEDAYRNKYPNAVDVGTRDYLDYKGRAYPFPVSGGTSITKILEFYQVGGSTGPDIDGFDLTLVVHTTDDSTVNTAVYSCGRRPLPDDRIRWCGRED